MSMSKIRLIAVALLALALQANAEDSLSKEEIADLLPGVKRSQVGDSPMAGVYEIAMDTNIAYISDDGRYLIQGEMYDLETNANLTEAKRSSARVSLLSSVAPERTIIFGPQEEAAEHKVVVFTDIDCGYCRKLHREMAEINDLGIEVVYLFYPRSGPGTASWRKAGDVWCAEDRNDAMTMAKTGGDVPVAKCDAPVQSHYELGRKLGVRGTPAIYTESGVQVGGYLPAAALLGRLQALDEAS